MRLQKVDLLDWAAALTDEEARFIVFYGGRGSGKSWQVGGGLTLQGYEQPLRIACVREVQNSIKDSSKQLIDDWIDRLGLRWFYRSTQYDIWGKNGTHFFFRGLSGATEESVRGWEGVNRVWIEEAHRMTARSREILYPTIFRVDGSQIIVTFNPHTRSDPVYMDFVSPGRRLSQSRVVNVNYTDNEFFPDGLEMERLEWLEHEPDRYKHVWLGVPDDEGAQRKVITFAVAQLCVDAFDRMPSITGRADGGLDIADTGADRNALVGRRGPLIFHAERWAGLTTGKTAAHADLWARDNGNVARLYYDRTGVGAGVRSDFMRMDRREYKALPINFGGEVKGKRRKYTLRTNNEDFFSNRYSQMAWVLHRRALRTQRLMNGEDVDPMDCLFIDPSIPDLEFYLTQLSQPEWEANSSGKIVIHKQPSDDQGVRRKKAVASPDLFDGTALAFASDSEFGVRLGR